jgi:hypothetical protein
MRPTISGGRAIDSARHEVRRLAADADRSTVIETALPGRALAAATEWLDQQGGRRELAIVSDFQGGTLAPADVDAVPRAVGLRLVRIPVRDNSAPVDVVARGGETESIAHATLTSDGTAVEWTTRAATVRRTSDALTVLAGPDERAHAGAALRAAETIPVRLPLDSAHTITIVYPHFAQRAELVRSSHAPHSRWAVDVVARLFSDPLLAVAASSTTAATIDAADTTDAVVVARSAAGQPVAVAKQDSAQGHERLLLFVFADAGSLAPDLVSTALIAGVNAARSNALPLAELEPTTIPTTTLDSWQRAPAADAHPRNLGAEPGNSGSADGRWFWIVALVLLALETWIRRALPAPTARSVADGAHDRAA